MKTLQYFSVFAIVSTFAAIGCSAADDTAQSDDEIKNGT